ncbi:hypothetical protein DITRI_Ditri09bG0112900 [Diplodiscus trichospermus]
MADGMAGATSPAGGSHESGGEQSSPHSNVREQDRYLPIANISRIMKKALPSNGKIAKDAKDTVQECVSEFISFITSEASDKCQKEKRKTINGDDLLWAMATLGFEDYIEPLKIYLSRYREVRGELFGLFVYLLHFLLDPFLSIYSTTCLAVGRLNGGGDTKGSARGGDGSLKRDAVGALAAQNSQFAIQGSLSYINCQDLEISFSNDFISVSNKLPMWDEGTRTAYDHSLHARQRVVGTSFLYKFYEY